MFDYTKTALDKIKTDFNRLIFVVRIVMQVLGIVYLLYSLIVNLITPSWKLCITIPLLLIAVTAFAFFLLEKRKYVQKTVKTISTYCKRSLKFLSLAITMYSLFSAASNVNPADVIFTALLLVIWLLQVVFDLLAYLIISRIDMFKAALVADVEEVKRPVEAVGNFFKRMSGKEIEPPKEKSKHRIWLDEKVSQSRQERAERKKADKQQKKEEKLRKKSEKKKK